MGVGQSTNPTETQQAEVSSASSGLQEHDANSERRASRAVFGCQARIFFFLFTGRCLINQANLFPFLKCNLESEPQNTGKAYEYMCFVLSQVH